MLEDSFVDLAVNSVLKEQQNLIHKFKVWSSFSQIDTEAITAILTLSSYILKLLF